MGIVFKFPNALKKTLFGHQPQNATLLVLVGVLGDIKSRRSLIRWLIVLNLSLKMPVSKCLNRSENVPDILFRV